jgi:hypothetical protein
MRYGLTCTATIFIPDYASVFTKTEEYVEGLESQSLRRLKRNLDKKTKYKSLYDQILCSACPYMKEHCKAYYCGIGPDLEEQLSEFQIKLIDRSLWEWVKAITLAIN